MGIKETCKKGAGNTIDVMHGISVGNIIKYPLSWVGAAGGFVIGSCNFAVRKSGILGLDRGNFQDKHELFVKSIPSSKLNEGETRPKAPGLDSFTGPRAAAGIIKRGIQSSFSSTLHISEAAKGEGQPSEPEESHRGPGTGSDT